MNSIIDIHTTHFFIGIAFTKNTPCERAFKTAGHPVLKIPNSLRVKSVPLPRVWGGGDRGEGETSKLG